jgi:hypothetical protein
MRKRNSLTLFQRFWMVLALAGCLPGLVSASDSTTSWTLLSSLQSSEECPGEESEEVEVFICKTKGSSQVLRRNGRNRQRFFPESALVAFSDNPSLTLPLSSSESPSLSPPLLTSLPSLCLRLRC